MENSNEPVVRQFSRADFLKLYRNDHLKIIIACEINIEKYKGVEDHKVIFVQDQVYGKDEQGRPMVTQKKVKRGEYIKQQEELLKAHTETLNAIDRLLKNEDK